ncbi:Rha family transcriptional regulator [Pseudomonas sp. Irchel s3h17]|uniref:Rha family transcriptional regulator n=1 Tax=Pseudomonas sp. Irchel s3h17 TaxID=2009182 RepID=UPI001C478D59|nr:Rha family transcriptional regulator [Pseudomonas sp. Irchel s3h17]
MADQGKVVTTSLRVAAYFGRAHKAVLRKIANMKCSSEFNRRNFALVEYLDAKGEQRPMRFNCDHGSRLNRPARSEMPSLPLQF